MNKLGLIGGTGSESTIEYYKGIEYGVQQKSGHSFFPNLTIESLSVFDVLGFCGKQDYAGLTEYLLKGVRNLAAAGAQYAALTGITPHIVFDELSQASPIVTVLSNSNSTLLIRRIFYELNIVTFHCKQFTNLVIIQTS